MHPDDTSETKKNHSSQALTNATGWGISMSNTGDFR